MLREISLLVVACLLTASMELVILYLLKVRDKRLWFSIPINIGTNLLLNSSLALLRGLDSFIYYTILVAFELLVVIIEALFYQLIKRDNKNYLYSLFANLVSGLIGSLLVYFLFIFIP